MILRFRMHGRRALMLAATLCATVIANPQGRLKADTTGERSSAQSSPQARGSQPPPGFPDLVSGLKAVPGCLGVETARTSSGKQVIFAWFENKEAVLRWYYSDMHQQVMKQFFPTRDGHHKPLANIPDSSGPIMAIASLTLAEKGQIPDTSLPLSQIAIELYQPVSGGLAIGGRFAPDSLKVPGLVDYSPKKTSDR